MQFLADENLDSDIVRALRRRMPSLDIVRVQEVGLTGVDGLGRGESMPGVVIVPQLAAIARCIEDLLLLAECAAEDDCDGRVIFLPL